MTDMPRLSPHARMVHRMADANGLNLTEATRTGQVSADDVSDVIQSCARCGAREGCKSWLATVEAPVTTAPGFCRNKPWFDGMKGR